jgi:hypothetical protein
MTSAPDIVAPNWRPLPFCLGAGTDREPLPCKAAVDSAEAFVAVSLAGPVHATFSCLTVSRSSGWSQKWSTGSGVGRSVSSLSGGRFAGRLRWRKKVFELSIGRLGQILRICVTALERGKDSVFSRGRSDFARYLYVCPTNLKDCVGGVSSAQQLTYLREGGCGVFPASLRLRCGDTTSLFLP